MILLLRNEGQESLECYNTYTASKYVYVGKRTSIKGTAFWCCMTNTCGGFDVPVQNTVSISGIIY